VIPLPLGVVCGAVTWWSCSGAKDLVASGSERALWRDSSRHRSGCRCAGACCWQGLCHGDNMGNGAAWLGEVLPLGNPMHGMPVDAVTGAVVAAATFPIGGVWFGFGTSWGDAALMRQLSASDAERALAMAPTLGTASSPR